MRPVVADTTMLSNFAHAQRAELLRPLFGGNLATTPTVMAELHAGEQRELVPECDWEWLTTHELIAAEDEQATRLRQQLDAGEAECLAVALVLNVTFLFDVFTARPLAS